MAAWKTVRITKPCHLSIDNGHLLIQDKENHIRLSLEDTDCIVFEGNRFTLTASVLIALSRYKVATLFCDDSYMPSTILHPYHQSLFASETIKAQIALTDSYKERLWQQIIEAKVSLQAEVLEHFGHNSTPIKRYVSNILPADRYNVEAKSARYYWKKLFTNFKREQNSFDIRNQALNYAYAVTRSLISRNLSAAGFLPALGIWHKNSTNAFNLSDDLMEPFRPLIDLAIAHLLPSFDDDFLIPAFKRSILNIFDLEYLIYENGLSSVRNISKRYIENFKRSVQMQDPKILTFPTIAYETIDECF
jgi:CRISPR-associated protein Cas1